MTRSRKNAAKAQDSLLTPDNVIEIPVEEQPYPLPEGWKWVRLGSVVSASKKKTEDFSSPSLRYIGLEHFEKDNGITGFAPAEGVRSLKNIFYSGQILYGKLRPYLNKHDIAGFDGVCSTDILVFDSLIGTNNKFINYFFNLNYFKEYVVANSKGINLPRVSEHAVLKAVFPLPPIDEQQRIVNRIESLFAKLDEAKSKAEVVLADFEIRKAALLHKAFTGELTAKWREIRGVGMDSWDIKKLGQCGTWVGGGTPSTANSEYWNEGKLLWITSKDMKYDIVTDTLVHINEKALGNSSAILVKNPSLIFVLRSGILRRTFPIAMVEKEFTINQDLKSLTPTNIFILKFLFYECKNFAKKILHTCVKDGTTVESIQFNALKNIDIYVPSVPEQNEIVRILDNLLEKEQQVKEAAENVLNQIDLMKKAILARAFRGELGTHDSVRNSLQNNGSM